MTENEAITKSQRHYADVQVIAQRDQDRAYEAADAAYDAEMSLPPEDGLQQQRAASNRAQAKHDARERYTATMEAASERAREIRLDAARARAAQLIDAEPA